jgi:Asp-tRNA(Asn)/Glu-tRNA(Gln) amidotransferase A subunit family amidase
MALSWSNDHVGPLTATVRDAALMLHIIAGDDGVDATASRRRVPDYLSGIEGGVAALRIGVPENYYFDGVDGAVASAVRALAGALASEGAEVIDIELPDPHAAFTATALISSVESTAVHGHLERERPDDIGPIARTRLAAGRRISALDYGHALRLRPRLLRTFMREVFAEVDVVIVPTTPEPAPLRSEAMVGAVEEVIGRMARFARLTRPFNGLGLPVLAVPCGWSSHGLPLSAQLVGRPFDEATLLRAGRAWERTSVATASDNRRVS